MNETKTQIESFINALQLSITTPIASHMAACDDRMISITFASVPHADQGFEYFRKLVDADWSEQERRLTIKDFQALLAGPLYNFLMLSRLRDENMRALARLDPQYRPFVQKILGSDREYLDENVETPQKASQVIFQKVEQHKMTLRELAQRSGLTQTALSNLKAGSDLRLSSLLKILKALRLHLAIHK